MIHHLRDRAAAFGEAFRVLRDGARMATATDSEWIIRNREPLARYFPETIEVELARYPSIEQLQIEMTRAGFVQLSEELVEHAYELIDSAPFREKVFSTLLYLSNEAFTRGLARLETDLSRGPIPCVSRYTLLWGHKAPAAT